MIVKMVNEVKLTVGPPGRRWPWAVGRWAFGPPGHRAVAGRGPAFSKTQGATGKQLCTY